MSAPQLAVTVTSQSELLPVSQSRESFKYAKVRHVVLFSPTSIPQCTIVEEHAASVGTDTQHTLCEDGMDFTYLMYVGVGLVIFLVLMIVLKKVCCSESSSASRRDSQASTGPPTVVVVNSAYLPPQAGAPAQRRASTDSQQPRRVSTTASQRRPSSADTQPQKAQSGVPGHQQRPPGSSDSQPRKSSSGSQRRPAANPLSARPAFDGGGGRASVSSDAPADHSSDSLQRKSSTRSESQRHPNAFQSPALAHYGSGGGRESASSDVPADLEDPAQKNHVNDGGRRLQFRPLGTRYDDPDLSDPDDV
jgi:hypothetical protein